MAVSADRRCAGQVGEAQGLREQQCVAQAGRTDKSIDRQPWNFVAAGPPKGASDALIAQVEQEEGWILGA